MEAEVVIQTTPLATEQARIECEAVVGRDRRRQVACLPQPGARPTPGPAIEHLGELDVPAITEVATPLLVATVPREDNLDVASRELADRERGERREVRERCVEVVEENTPRLEQVVRRDRDLFVVGLIPAGDLARQRALISGVGYANGEAPHGPVTALRQSGGDDAGVEPPAEKDADGDVRYGLCRHGRADESADFFFVRRGRTVRGRPARERVKIPVSSRLVRPAGDAEPVCGWEQAYPGERRRGSRKVSRAQVERHLGEVET